MTKRKEKNSRLGSLEKEKNGAKAANGARGERGREQNEREGQVGVAQKKNKGHKAFPIEN